MQSVNSDMEESGELSDRQIAKGLGVSNPFISKIRKEMEDSGELLTVNSSIGADGKVRPRKPYLLIDETPEGQKSILDSERLQ